jgi:hypothetical protein
MLVFYQPWYSQSTPLGSVASCSRINPGIVHSQMLLLIKSSTWPTIRFPCCVYFPPSLPSVKISARFQCPIIVCLELCGSNRIMCRCNTVGKAQCLE